MYFVLLAVSYWKAVTIDLFLSQAFTLGKLVILMLFFFIARRPFILFGLLCFFLWLVLKQPKLQHPLLVEIKSEEHFESMLNFPASKSKGLVFGVFYANWNERCTYVSQESQLSDTATLGINGDQAFECAVLFCVGEYRASTFSGEEIQNPEKCAIGATFITVDR